jgi:sugar lactone lactonase YvrE
MKKLFALVLLPVTFYSCSNKSENQSDATEDTTSSEVVEATTPTLTKAWETDTVLTTAESTLYDEDDQIVYVSNINGNHSEKDGNGFISKISPDGSVIQLQWVAGLNAPKGMAILDDKLYVTDIDEIVEISIADSSIANRYPVEGATFLNDAATDGEKVYVSDSGTGKVHVLEDGKVNTVTEGLEGINGLAFNDAGELFILDGEGLLQYDMEGDTTTTLNDVVTGGDGLVIIDDSTFIASRWQGEIYLVKGGKEYLLLDTKAEESNTADIDYIADENLVLVPTFMKSKVVAYELEY